MKTLSTALQFLLLAFAASAAIGLGARPAAAQYGQVDAPEKLYLGVDCDPADEATVLNWLAGAVGAPAPRALSRREASKRRGNTGHTRSSSRTWSRRSVRRDTRVALFV